MQSQWRHHLSVVEPLIPSPNYAVCPLADPGALGAEAPFTPKIFFKIMQLSGNNGWKKPYFEQILGSGPPLGKKTTGPP